MTKIRNKKGIMKTNNNELIMQNKVFGWVAAGTAAILAIPLIAMQFSSEWNWNFMDFIVMGTLIFGTGFLFVHVARVTPRKYRTLIGIGFFLGLLWLWAELAVGVFTNWGN
jgi:hypothetical protein